MQNSIETLNAKEQHILRTILNDGCYNSLKRFDMDVLQNWYKTFQNDNKQHLTWTMIQQTIKSLVAKKILSEEKQYLNPAISLTGRKMFVKIYKIKQHWRTRNSYEIKQFRLRSMTKMQISNQLSERMKSKFVVAS